MNHMQQPSPRILNPVVAIADALTASARFDIPITHLVATYGLVQGGVPA